ncbi:MAG: anti-sigma factor, partial [Ahrensia sp.]
STRSPWWETVGFWRGLSIASVAALFFVTSLMALNTQTSPVAPQQRLVAQLSGADSVLRVTAAYDPETQTVRINRTAGAPNADRALELWVIAGDDAPVSLGLLPDEATGEIDVTDEIAQRILANAIFAISDEPQGGSPTGQPTGAVLATGSVAEI